MRDDIDQVLDAACGRFYAHDAEREGRLTRLYVSREVYEAVLEARRGERARGVPVLLLDLDLLLDPSLAGAEIRVA